jgi:hypothetical protein
VSELDSLGNFYIGNAAQQSLGTAPTQHARTRTGTNSERQVPFKLTSGLAPLKRREKN